MGIMNFAILIFAIALLGCSLQPKPNIQAQYNGLPAGNSQFKKAGVLAPIWQQTDRIFYNKTSQPMTVVLVEEGKIRTKDGKTLERSDGGTLGQDGIFREYILKEDGSQEYVTREYKETPLTLNPGDCVLTSFAFFWLKIRGKTVCDTLRHGEPEPKRVCFDELRKVRNQNGWHTNKRSQGSFPYVEFYNIVNGEHLFEGAGEPRPFDNSFTHSCKILAKVNYSSLERNTQK